ncbi:hypothetical protein PoB_004966600 [Plakobranchus ocellatus]|uniref:Uncharacterized protein n=1 Tax=Plakobranchus ocellatus TaxID=259542 RepID=A0AAV4BVP0_9GAST|nr:hypothetical protein PoB_004966600 [Plakobranchus ocellatus]
MGLHNINFPCVFTATVHILLVKGNASSILYYGYWTARKDNASNDVISGKMESTIGSGGSSGRAVGYQLKGPKFESQSGASQFFTAPLCPPSNEWVARSLKKVKAARKAMANYFIMPYAKNNHGSTPGSPMLRLRVGPIYFYP